MQALSLSIYVAFVGLAFRFAQRKRADVSVGLWIPQIWLLIAASRPIVYWINPDSFGKLDYDFVSGSPVDRAVFSLLLLVGVVILINRRLDWRFILKRNHWLFALCVYVGVTVLWSDYEYISLKRWVRAVGDLVMVLIVVTERNPQAAIKVLIMRCGILLLPLSIVFIKYFPHLGVAYTEDGEKTMWVGVTTHKNELGALALVCGIPLILSLLDSWRRRKIKWFDVALMVMILWVLRGSSTAGSATSVLAFIMSLVLILFLQVFRPDPRRLWQKAAIVCLAYVLLEYGFEAVSGSSLYVVISQSFGRDPTLTGRTDLWVALLKLASENPILGTGFGGFWIGNTHGLWKQFIWYPTQAHNGYIDVYLQTGLLGLALLILSIYSGYKNVIQDFYNDFEYASIRFVFLIITCIHNFTESSFLRGSSLIWFFFLLSSVAARSRNSKKTPPPGKKT